MVLFAFGRLCKQRSVFPSRGWRRLAVLGSETRRKESQVGVGERGGRGGGEGDGGGRGGRAEGEAWKKGGKKKVAGRV